MQLTSWTDCELLEHHRRVRGWVRWANGCVCDVERESESDRDRETYLGIEQSVCHQECEANVDGASINQANLFFHLLP